MANKKFYIFLFINFFLFKNYPGCLCRKKKPESNIYFKDGDYPTIKLQFKKKIDIDEIYYDIFLYIEKEGNTAKDSLCFYYGTPSKLGTFTFSPYPNFLDELDDNPIEELAKSEHFYQIEEKYIQKDINNEKDLSRKYYSNYSTYRKHYYYYFVDKENNKKIYKKLLPIKKEDYKTAFENTTFTIDKYEEKKNINEIKVSAKDIDKTSCDYKIATEFYIKNKDQTITVEFYRSEVQNTEYFTFSCEIFLNGKKIDGKKNIINNKNEDKNNIFTIDN